MARVGFEPTISAGERPKTYALDRAAIGTGACLLEPRNSIILLIECQFISAEIFPFF